MMEGCVLPRALGALLAELDAYEDRIPDGVLPKALAELELGCQELEAFIRFDARGYHRSQLHLGPAYETLLIAWCAGQRSAIHDHRGSRCAFRVLRGVASETAFARNPAGLIYPTTTRPLAAGSIGAIEDDGVHQLSNLQERDDLVTLHLYSPPLERMGTYSLTDSQVQERAASQVEFEAGAGI